MFLPDPVPLGVSGSVVVPRTQYAARVGTNARTDSVLVSEADRTTYVARRLANALQRPLAGRGSEAIAKAALTYFPDIDALAVLAEKGIESLRDGQRHDRLLLSAATPRVAVWFVAWNGTHREVQSERFGKYLDSLVGTANYLTRRGIALAGFLEIDAYVRENPDPEDPGLPLEQVFEVDVEFSFLPGGFLGFPKDRPNPFPRVFFVNGGLCSPEQHQALRKLMA
jgi:hypothetical protein